MTDSSTRPIAGRRHRVAQAVVEAVRAERGPGPGGSRRIALRMGDEKVITYWLEDESGASLRAVGARVVGTLKPKERSVPSRPRERSPPRRCRRRGMPTKVPPGS